MNKEENIDYINSIHDSYIKELQKQDEYIKKIENKNKKYKEVIDKANKKLTNMFDNGDENKILDDLLELSKILEVK